jgi:hypothetical protein
MFKMPNRRHYVICDDCGRKRLSIDTVIVNDKYNLFNGMVICKDHYEKSNPSLWPDRSYERPLQAKDKLRPDQSPQFVAPESTDLLPSIPKNLNSYGDSISNTIILYWDAPDLNGSGGINGYQITRAYPQLAYQAVINVNTNNPSPSYIDSTANPAQAYTYTVSAINAAGLGPPSQIYYYPTIEENTINLQYLTTNGTQTVLTTNNGQTFITVRH